MGAALNGLRVQANERVAVFGTGSAGIDHVFEVTARPEMLSKGTSMTIRFTHSVGDIRCGTRRRVTLTGPLFAVVSIAVACSSIGLARAEVSQMAPHSRDRTTADGWSLSVSLSGEAINVVPNLAGAQNSREAFVTLSAQANIDGASSNPITAASFVAGYQVGCQIDVSQGLQIGGTGLLAGSLSADVGAAPGVQLGGTDSLGGYLQTNLQPGVITSLPMGNMVLARNLGRLDLQDVHLKVDACGGPVTVRSYATMAVATDVAQTQLSVYGDPFVVN
ncbi:MspA family porin [Mycolicibacterium mengxianglii]|uniref:MspA family porin n=1 Tax=Mycolicibacterium mengxianglii TaxID=2736649 RepID=UPI0027D9F864|nr:MspA family porin [Mycolicibacterium mengxianglii]